MFFENKVGIIYTKKNTLHLVIDDDHHIFSLIGRTQDERIEMFEDLVHRLNCLINN